jgi:aconitate hydratase
MSPRLLGAKAVIVRSFARIHETNLKKQGILPLTFADPDDYDKIFEADTISITGLDEIAPGKPVRAVIHHFEGGDEEIDLTHTMSGEQLEWFRAGAALNILGK